MPTFTFTASRLAPDNRLHPCRIEIDTVNVIYSKGYIFGYKSTAIVRTALQAYQSAQGFSLPT
jgi:hypothetical protein